jgi:monoamine oxidase
MKTGIKMENIIIIGAGLSGLSTAYNLKKQNIQFKVFEAQNRMGGRIETIYGKNNTPMEMGATWFGKDHKNLIHFLAELNVEYFEQNTEGIALFETMSFEPPQKYFVPANNPSSYRIQGGTSQIIKTLKEKIGVDNIILNAEIIQIEEQKDCIKITDNLQNNFYCKKLVVAIPPNIIKNSLKFIPEMPENVNDIIQKTQTWMSGSTKFSVEYETPFWKKIGFSGSVYSQCGFATEIYDHSNFEKTRFALKGFLNSSAQHFTIKERKEKVIKQLEHYFGDKSIQFLSYQDKIWNNKYIQSNTDTFLAPHYNNGHSVYENSYMNNKLFFTGTETSSIYGGYMEGAIFAANSVVKKILKTIIINHQGLSFTNK